MRPAKPYLLGAVLCTVLLSALICGDPNDYGDKVACLDEDRDGFVARTTCPELAPGEMADCDETRADRNPGMDEAGTEDFWYDGIDQDCDGEDIIDQDGDTYPGIFEEDWEAQHLNMEWPTGLHDERDCDDQDRGRYPDNPDESSDCRRDPGDAL
ncbi:MAG: hypothetical protein JRJ84_24995 [Deltaproteobacteria bacterium]|nr:hypothetical protein [Deltaproteobacteria bacterium]